MNRATGFIRFLPVPLVSISDQLISETRQQNDACRDCTIWSHWRPSSGATEGQSVVPLNRNDAFNHEEYAATRVEESASPFHVLFAELCLCHFEWFNFHLAVRHNQSH